MWLPFLRTGPFLPLRSGWRFGASSRQPRSGVSVRTTAQLCTHGWPPTSQWLWGGRRTRSRLPVCLLPSTPGAYSILPPTLVGKAIPICLSPVQCSLRAGSLHSTPAQGAAGPGSRASCAEVCGPWKHCGHVRGHMRLGNGKCEITYGG